jgi:hypothetical protein
MDPKTPTEKPTPSNNPNPNSLKLRLMGEAAIEAGRKNNEPSMVAAGERMLQKAATPTKPTDS